MASTLKPCRKCGIPFIGKYCKPCDNARSAARRKADPKKASADVLAWKKNNPERTRELNKVSYHRNKESIAIRAKQFRSANRSRLDAYNQAYDAAHPEKRIARQRKRDQKDREILSDRYIKSTYKLWKVDVPQEVLETLRVIMKIRKFIREQK